jgi:predicted CxxxxCH...CXXCH cytochrome family protein
MTKTLESSGWLAWVSRVLIFTMMFGLAMLPGWNATMTAQAATLPSTITSCGDCHGNPPVDSGTRDASVGRFPGSHNKHSNTTTGYAYACSVCHVEPATYNHRNGNIQMANPINGDAGAAYGKGTSWAQTNTPSAFEDCTSTYCHSQGVSQTGQPGDTRTISAPVTTLGWSSTGACGSCHGAPPAYANGTALWGAAKANSHGPHSSYNCSLCHYGTTTDGATITDKTKHINRTYDILDNGVESIASYSYTATGGTCNTVSCHANTGGIWGDPNSVSCLTCHNAAVGSRAAVIPAFNAQSHHIQKVGGPLTTDCAACHWEAQVGGKADAAYHKNGVVDLVTNYTTTRPATPAGNIVSYYTASATRTEYAKLNTHCLGCHDANSATAQPFGDGKTPQQYAWDSLSIDSRYSQAGTTAWGKYSGLNTTPKNTQRKALSAHGNAAANQRGWNTTETWPNTSGTAQILCFDCHNSHGSSVAGATVSYATGTGGILKDVLTGVGGYTVTYKPTTGGNALAHNVYNPGAGICFDCHENANMNAAVSGGNTPWGYTGTFGASQPIRGYFDKAYWNGLDVAQNGAQQRFPNTKGTRTVAGGHFGASSTPGKTVSGTIGGLCTPCHDPHGVSTSLGADNIYAVPLLKGTWMTSPYKEDAGIVGAFGRRGGRSSSTSGAWTTGANNPGMGQNGYHIDQNTFQSTNGTLYTRTKPATITQTAAQFGGLCLNCHTAMQPPQGAAQPAWSSVDRIHNSVKGWASTATTAKNVNNDVHAYVCSKCHTSHNTCLPRLAITNCLDFKHRQQRVSGGTAGQHLGSSSRGSGRGRFPGGGGGASSSGTSSAYMNGRWYFGTAGTNSSSATNWSSARATNCHTTKTANGTAAWPNNTWNSITQW